MHIRKNFILVVGLILAFLPRVEAATVTLESLLNGGTIINGDWFLGSFKLEKEDSSGNGCCVDPSKVMVTDTAQPTGGILLTVEWNGELAINGVGTTDYWIDYTVQNTASNDIIALALQTGFGTNVPDTSPNGATLSALALAMQQDNTNLLPLETLLNTSVNPNQEISAAAGELPTYTPPLVVRNQYTFTSNLDAAGDFTNSVDTTENLILTEAIADLALTLTAEPVPVGLSSPITYTVSVTNNGPSFASGLTTGTQLDGQTTFVSANSGSATPCTESAGLVACAINGLKAGATWNSQIVATSPDVEATVIATSNVTLNELDPDGANNSDAASTNSVSMQVAADLAVQLAVSPNPVALSSAVSYGASVTNNGPNTATGVKAVYALDPGVKFSQASNGCAETTPGVVVCDIGALSPLQTWTGQVAATSPATAGDFTSGIVAAGAESDPNPDNNAAAATAAAVAQTFTADLGVTMTVAPDPANLSARVTYSATVTNNGPDMASSVQAGFALDAGVGFLEATSGCTHDAQTVICDIGSITSMNASTVQVTVTAPSSAGEFTSDVFTAGAESDPDTANNSASATSTSTEPPPPPPADDDDCFIATAAYGSFLEPEVRLLRNFRDRYLLTNGPGQAFVAWYYRTSPPVADVIAENESLRLIARVALSPLVYAIKYPAAAGMMFLLMIIAPLGWKRREAM